MGNKCGPLLDGLTRGLQHLKRAKRMSVMLKLLKKFSGFVFKIKRSMDQNTVTASHSCVSYRYPTTKVWRKMNHVRTGKNVRVSQIGNASWRVTVRVLKKHTLVLVCITTAQSRLNTFTQGSLKFAGILCAWYSVVSALHAIHWSKQLQRLGSAFWEEGAVQVFPSLCKITIDRWICSWCTSVWWL